LEAERPEKHRPLIHHTQHHDVVRTAGVELPAVGHLALGIEREGGRRCVGGRKRRVGLHVDHQVVAVEQRVDVLADRGRESTRRHVAGLRAAGQDLPARLGDGDVEQSPGEENHHGLQQGEEQADEGGGHEPEFDRRHSVLAPDERLRTHERHRSAGK